MKLVSGIVDSGFFAQSALSAEVATKDSLGRNISETYLTGVDLTPYQTTADMVNYQTTAGMTAYLTAVPESYLQNTDLTITDGKVTEISGVPLSAGDELPSGVMNTSALEYNAVNEISGYNGSAIAQYGAEKQWLVHDDTIVHISNSAQYALGVNLSAIAQLLGVDETVLWSNTASAMTKDLTFPLTLNETIANFKRVKFLYGADSTVQYAHWIEYEATDNHTYTLYDFRCDGTGTATAKIYWRLGRFNISGTAVTNPYNSTINLNTAFNGDGFNTNGYNYLVQIVGIGRKEV